MRRAIRHPPMKPTGSTAVVPRPPAGKGNMAEDTLTTSGIGRHGATRLPSVDVDSYNVELKDADGFLGDRASKKAFHAILDELREPLRKASPVSTRVARIAGTNAEQEAGDGGYDQSEEQNRSVDRKIGETPIVAQQRQRRLRPQNCNSAQGL